MRDAVTRYRYIAIVTLVVGISGAFLWAQEREAELQGAQPYIPSRLEWLSLQVNASNSIRFEEGHNFMLNCIPLDNADTILILVQYTPNVNREIMNLLVQNARDVLEKRTEARGWDSWIEIREEFRMIREED